ncbi:Cyclophilin type peptidyl-prolyl cis-trans isomerase/CLD [uncultured archaeon]|nr:Cyclophilin type peptidyl-prolyl cis-trans isomerase/CLD [uncultured archaeon]
MVNRKAIFETNKGKFMLELFEDKAPVTTGNFIKLVNQGFYNGLIIHRVIPQFMIQGGCPKGNGTGGPGYTIKDEFHKELSNLRGTIAMANRGPNTGGSQWFINLVDNCYLDFDKKPYTSAHPVFGKVIEGMNVVDEISKTKADRNDKPLQDVLINKITIT